MFSVVDRLALGHCNVADQLREVLRLFRSKSDSPVVRKTCVSASLKQKLSLCVRCMCTMTSRQTKVSIFLMKIDS